MENKHHLTVKQLEAREAFMKEMKNEINQIQYDIDHLEETNKKITRLRKFKTSLVIGRLLAPYIAAAGITFGAFHALGHAPFLTDDVKKQLEIKKEIDSLGNVHTEEQYGRYEDTLEYLTYYGKWELNQANVYEREVRTYSLGNVSEELVYEIFDNIDNISLDNLLGGNFSYKVEKRNRINKHELEAEPFLEAVIYDKDKNDYIIAKEDVSENIALTFVWLVLTYFSMKGIDFIREKKTSFSYYELMRKVKDQYPLVSEEELSQRLEVKMNNYKRLTR